MNIRGRGVLPWRDANGSRWVAQALEHVRAGGSGPCFEAPAPHLSGAAVLQLAADLDVGDHQLVAVLRQFDAGLEGVDPKPSHVRRQIDQISDAVCGHERRGDMGAANKKREVNWRYKSRGKRQRVQPAGTPTAGAAADAPAAGAQAITEAEIVELLSAVQDCGHGLSKQAAVLRAVNDKLAPGAHFDKKEARALYMRARVVARKKSAAGGLFVLRPVKKLGVRKSVARRAGLNEVPQARIHKFSPVAAGVGPAVFADFAMHRGELCTLEAIDSTVSKLGPPSAEVTLPAAGTSTTGGE